MRLPDCMSSALLPAEQHQNALQRRESCYYVSGASGAAPSTSNSDRCACLMPSAWPIVSVHAWNEDCGCELSLLMWELSQALQTAARQRQRRSRASVCGAMLHALCRPAPTVVQQCAALHNALDISCKQHLRAVAGRFSVHLSSPTAAVLAAAGSLMTCSSAVL
jgi:hypothetical protein